MKIKVKVKPNSSKEKIVKKKDFWKVYLNSPPQEGKANEQLIKLLANYLNVSPNQVFIISGHKASEKVVEVWK
jgi:hypothetical protein